MKVPSVPGYQQARWNSEMALTSGLARYRSSTQLGALFRTATHG
ncbi:hypothetical protein [Actinomadura nitritigenes]|nr:hypothetical protein [Actinomadura nitritigenes]